MASRNAGNGSQSPAVVGDLIRSVPRTPDYRTRSVAEAPTTVPEVDSPLSCIGAFLIGDHSKAVVDVHGSLEISVNHLYTKFKGSFIEGLLTKPV
jgi:hypothetical protein